MVESIIASTWTRLKQYRWGNFFHMFYIEPIVFILVFSHSLSGKILYSHSYVCKYTHTYDWFSNYNIYSIFNYINILYHKEQLWKTKLYIWHVQLFSITMRVIVNNWERKTLLDIYKCILLMININV